MGPRGAASLQPQVQAAELRESHVLHDLGRHWVVHLPEWVLCLTAHCRSWAKGEEFGLRFSSHLGYLTPGTDPGKGAALREGAERRFPVSPYCGAP